MTVGRHTEAPGEAARVAAQAVAALAKYMHLTPREHGIHMGFFGIKTWAELRDRIAERYQRSLDTGCVGKWPIS